MMRSKIVQKMIDDMEKDHWWVKLKRWYRLKKWVIRALIFNRNQKEQTRPEMIKIDSKTLDKDAIPVENFNGVLGYICANVTRSIQLTTYLKKELTELFGKHNTTYRGEFFYYVWLIEYDGEIYNIYTANGKGTQFAIVANRNDNKSAKCKRFLKEMELNLNSLKK